MPPGTASGAPLAAGPKIPLAWPTGVGVSENRFYVCHTYSRRVVRVEKTHAAEAVSDLK